MVHLGAHDEFWNMQLCNVYAGILGNEKVFPYKFQKVRTSKGPQGLLHPAFNFTDERNAQ